MVEKPISDADGHDGGGGSGTEAKERKGLWSPEENDRLYTQITCHGVSTWSSVAQLAGLRRSGKSCRLRWMNYLRPDLKKEPISKREEETIISLQKSLGNRWSVIAARMPGRTDNEIKNYWNSRIRKRQNSRAGGGKAGGSAKQGADPPAAETIELAPAGEEDPVTQTAAPAVPIARFPVFACQLLDGGGARDAINAAAAGTQSTTTRSTTHEQNGGSESELSVGNGGGGGGEDAREQHYYYCADNGDMDMIHFLSFDDIEFLSGDLLTDAPGGALDDPWESQFYFANSGSSLNNFACYPQCATSMKEGD